MAFASDEIDRLAALSRLALTDEERRQLGPQLERILDYVETLRTVPTTDVPPTTHTLDAEAALRDDEPRPSLAREDALANAPGACREAGFFTVPRVIGG
jgi:aspartyl-tRNA(Asn)/glutamyl-tRNA(Gln) amidotransferase subunit C